jgi:Protein of unknown function (DUF3300)
MEARSAKFSAQTMQALSWFEALRIVDIECAQSERGRYPESQSKGMCSMVKQALITLVVFCAVMLAVQGGRQQSVGATLAPGLDATTSRLSPLEELLAPVALYPDALLAQTLTCATSPQQVIEIAKWLEQNTQLKRAELQDAVRRQGFDVSFAALAVFTDVLDMMAAHIDWTREIGTAFLSDPKGVMDSVQTLRAKARAAGNLKSTPQQSVVVRKAGGRAIIVIQPRNPQVVYIPVYNPQIVYWPVPVVAGRGGGGGGGGVRAAAAVIAFGKGLAIGTSSVRNLDHPAYEWGAWSVSWNSRVVIVRGGPWVVPPASRDRYVRAVPTVGGAYRPRAALHAPTNINLNVRASAYTARIAPPRAVAAGLASSGSRSASQAPRAAAASSSVEIVDYYDARGYSPGASQAELTADQAQTSSSAFSGYESAGAEQAASKRGRSSLSAGTGHKPIPAS